MSFTFCLPFKEKLVYIDTVFRSHCKSYVTALRFPWPTQFSRTRKWAWLPFFKMLKNLTRSALKCMCASLEKERMQLNSTETNSTVIPTDRLPYDSNTNRSSIHTEMNSSQRIAINTHGAAHERISQCLYLMDISEDVGACMCVHADAHTCKIDGFQGPIHFHILHSHTSLLLHF